MKRPLKFMAALIFYSTCAFLALRKFLFQHGTLGHNWDWSVPCFKDQLIYMVQNSFFIWKETVFGNFNPFGVNFAPFSFMWGSLVYLGVNGGFASKFLPFISIVIAGIAMFYLVTEILKKNSNANSSKLVFYSALFGGLFYALSPYLFNDIIGGANTQFFTYAFFPLALYYLKKLEYSNEFIHIFLLAFVLTIIAFSFQKLLLISIVLFVYPVFNKKTLRIYKNLLKSYLLFACLSFYWILFIPLGGAKLGFSLGKQTLLLSTIKNNVPNISDAFVGLGYFRDFFKYSINPNIHILWHVSSYGLLLITISSILISKKVRQKSIFFWIFLFLVSLIFSTGGKHPFGSLVLWLYKNIPFMALFRSPQHLLILSTFSLSVILGVGFFAFVSKTKKERPQLFFPILLLLFVCLIIWISPFLTGNFGFDYLHKNRGGNFLDTYNLSPGYKELLEKTFIESEDFRILPLPMSFSPYYLKTDYQREGQGGDPILSHSRKPFIVVDNFQNRFAAIIEKLFYAQNLPPNISKFLSFGNLKYIVLRKDIRPKFGAFVQIWDYSQMYNKLKQNENINLVKEYKYISLWSIKDFLPHIYSSHAPTIIAGDIEALVPMTETKIIFKKINPTKYLVKIEGAKTPFWLVFSESFHKQWRMYNKVEEEEKEDGAFGEIVADYPKLKVKEAKHLMKFTPKDIKYLFKEPLNAHHQLVNGYANGWYIEPNKLGLGEDFTLVLYFWPQTLFYLGLGISGLTLLCCIGYLGFSFMKGREKGKIASPSVRNDEKGVFNETKN